MPDQPHSKRRSPGAFRYPWFLLGCVCLLVASCTKPETDQAGSPAPVSPELAAARLALARFHLSNHAQDKALCTVVDALEADPASTEALAMATHLLATTRWHIPEITMAHRMRIDALDGGPSGSLIVALSGVANTAVRWDLKSLEIKAVSFPRRTEPTRSLVVDPTGQRLVAEREGVALLFDALTLKPICELGFLPDYVTPSATVVFSEDGLLLAHPEVSSSRAIIWHVRDSSSGQIIRSSEPTTPEKPKPLAAVVDRQGLRILSADGSQARLPISPAQPSTLEQPGEPIEMSHAQFASDGSSAWVARRIGNHAGPELQHWNFSGSAADHLDVEEMLRRFPWHEGPTIWNGLFRDSSRSPLSVRKRSAYFPGSSQAPIRSGSKLTAFAVEDGKIITGDATGVVTIYRALPLPTIVSNRSIARPPAREEISMLRYLVRFMTGLQRDDDGGSFSRLSPDVRARAAAECDLDVLRMVVPTLKFERLFQTDSETPCRIVAPVKLLPLWDRLVRADGSGGSWSKVLEMASALEGKSWYRDLASAIQSDARSSWLVGREMKRLIESCDSSKALELIQSVGEEGPAAAMVMQAALESEHAEWIEACLAKNQNLPPLLRQLAMSKVAWLNGHKSDALAGWPDRFPELDEVRRREDWDGWEQADFTRVYHQWKECFNAELATLEMAPDSTPDQRKEIVRRLTDPTTVTTVGRGRLARACLKAAMAMVRNPEDGPTAIRLATLARDLGEPAAPCLRAEAMAFAALGDFRAAHDRWLLVISGFPVEAHEPGDYAEAAYTAFENANPGQAMAILATGMHRFPDDPNFALRAGWVALLTANADAAYRFLLAGHRIGYPEPKRENAIALLAIAAFQTGAAEDAAAYYHELIGIDAAWEDPAILKTLDWPVELKSVLQELMEAPALAPEVPALLPPKP